MWQRSDSYCQKSTQKTQNLLDKLRYLQKEKDESWNLGHHLENVWFWDSVHWANSIRRASRQQLEIFLSIGCHSEYLVAVLGCKATLRFKTKGRNTGRK